MSLAIQELASRIKQLNREELLSLAPEDAAQLDWTLEDARCAERAASFDGGPLYWLTNLTKTENPQYEAQGREFLAPFPQKSYFVPLFKSFLANYPQLFICKSRTMMTSWAAVAFASWAAQWHREECVIQTLNIDRAAHLIDYARQLWDNQDPFLKERHPLARRSAFALSWEGGGEVAAVPSGADQIRAYHPTRYIQDESAFIVEGEEALGAVIPTGAYIICISTARASWFGDACSR
jgi:hypothetical protein